MPRRDEPDSAADINGGLANGEVIARRGPGIGEFVLVLHVDRQGSELVCVEDVAGGTVRLGPGGPLDIKDPSGHDGIESQAAAQIVGLIKAAVLDTGLRLQGLEVFLNRPAGGLLVSVARTAFRLGVQGMEPESPFQPGVHTGPFGTSLAIPMVSGWAPVVVTIPSALSA